MDHPNILLRTFCWGTIASVCSFSRLLLASTPIFSPLAKKSWRYIGNKGQSLQEITKDEWHILDKQRNLFNDNVRYVTALNMLKIRPNR